MFTDIRNSHVINWINQKTSSGTFCSKKMTPQILFRNFPDENEQEAKVGEHSSLGQVVSTITVIEFDNSTTPGTTLRITDGNEAGHFTLDSQGDNHVVRVAGQLNRESINQYRLTLQAEDLETPPRTSRATLVINIISNSSLNG